MAVSGPTHTWSSLVPVTRGLLMKGFEWRKSAVEGHTSDIEKRKETNQVAPVGDSTDLRPRAAHPRKCRVNHG